MPHIRQSAFVETGLMEESQDVASPLPCPASPRKSRRLAPLFSGLRISSRTSPNEEGPLSPRMNSPTPPSSPLTSASGSIQFRRPAFRHKRSQSLAIVPGYAPAPPLLRSVSSPTGGRLHTLNSPLSPLRTKTPSPPPPSLVFEGLPSLTPVRSRSPSVSSLETIADTPDAEEAAEAELIPVPKSPIELRSSGSPIRTHRKRWSVCGFEKRSDLELETIWEERGFNPQGQMQVARSGAGKVWIVDSESTEAHE